MELHRWGGGGGEEVGGGYVCLPTPPLEISFCCVWNWFDLILLNTALRGNILSDKLFNLLKSESYATTQL